MARSAEEAQRDLTPYLSRLIARCTAAIAEYGRLSPGTLAKFYARTSASIINDLWNHGVLTELGSDPRVRIDTKYARVRLFVDEKYQLRLKKVNRLLESSNIATQEELRFVNQVPPSEQLSLFPDLSEPVTNLTVGYQWDPLTNAVNVFVICPNVSGIDWVFPIAGDDESGAQAVRIPLPIAPRPTHRRVVAKRSVATKPVAEGSDG